MHQSEDCRVSSFSTFKQVTRCWRFQNVLISSLRHGYVSPIATTAYKCRKTANSIHNLDALLQKFRAANIIRSEDIIVIGLLYWHQSMILNHTKSVQNMPDIVVEAPNITVFNEYWTLLIFLHFV